MCTGIRLQNADGSTVHGRTAEFGLLLDIDIVVMPRGYTFTGTTPLGPGKQWTSKYAAAGVVAFDDEAIVDGVNEKGLAAGGFYFPTFASYPETTTANRDSSLSVAEFTNWILTSFASVDEVRAAIDGGEVTLSRSPLPGFGPDEQPFHFVVYDADGECVTIEPVDERLVVHENPVGAITNSPTFDWHLTNLRNYIALDPHRVPAVTIDGLSLEQLGQGSGLLGIPGDFTPPSRFVRAVVFCSTARPAADADTGVTQAFHILNNFDIPVGTVRTTDETETDDDFTQFTVVRDPQASRFYWKTYEDQTIRYVDLTELTLDATEIRRIGTKTTQPFVNETAELAS